MGTRVMFLLAGPGNFQEILHVQNARLMIARGTHCFEVFVLDTMVGGGLTEILGRLSRLLMEPGPLRAKVIEGSK